MESNENEKSNPQAVLTEGQVQEMLQQRAKLLATAEQMEHDKAELKKLVQAKIDALIPPELLQEMADLDAEFDTSGFYENIANLEKVIEDAVVGIGHTIKAEGAGQAVYSGGKVTWDAKKLEGLMVLLPQLEKVRSVGKPYAFIRK